MLYMRSPVVCSGELLAAGVGKWTHDDCVALHRILQEGLLADEAAAAGERGEDCVAMRDVYC